MGKISLEIEAGWFGGSAWRAFSLILFEVTEDGLTILDVQIAKFSLSVMVVW